MLLNAKYDFARYGVDICHSQSSECASWNFVQEPCWGRGDTVRDWTKLAQKGPKARIYY